MKFRSVVLYYLNKGLCHALYEYSYMIAFPKQSSNLNILRFLRVFAMKCYRRHCNAKHERIAVPYHSL